MPVNTYGLPKGSGSKPMKQITQFASYPNPKESFRLLQWVLPPDEIRSGVIIYDTDYVPTDNKNPPANAIIAYDSATFTGTSTTSCNYQLSRVGNPYRYLTIFSYCYTKNIRVYKKGVTISVYLPSISDTLIFTSSDVWTVPAGVYSIDVFAVGGGASGAGGYGSASQTYSSDSKYSSSSGGKGGVGAQAGSVMNIPVSPGQQIPITVAAGGQSVWSADYYYRINSNQPGGASSVDSIISVNGGSGATAGNGGSASWGTNSSGYVSSNSYTVASGSGANGTVYAFNDPAFDGILYGAGGGHGGARATDASGASSGTPGGVTGGGSGAYAGNRGGSGQDGTGAGGGGGATSTWAINAIYSTSFECRTSYNDGENTGSIGGYNYGGKGGNGKVIIKYTI